MALRLLWVTNLSAPYRRPVWAALAERASTTVGLLATTEPNRRWNSELPAGVSRLSLGVLRLVIVHVPLYALYWVRCWPDQLDAIVLPGWEHPAAWQLLVFARLRRVASVAFYESTPHSHRFRRGPLAWSRRWFLRHADAVLTVGEASRRAVLDLGVPAARVVTTHNAVDVSALSAVTEDAAARPGPPGPDRAARFVYVGQLVARKNVATLLRAFAALPGTPTLTVLGDGPLRDDLAALAHRLGVADRVRFAGYVEPGELGAHLSLAATLVLPSTEEVFGLAVVEALTVGLHAVVSDRAGVAPDVAAMPGVWLAEPTVPGLSVAMAASSAAWTGPVPEPAVRQWTPQRMAADVLRAVDLARATRAGRA